MHLLRDMFKIRASSVVSAFEAVMRILKAAALYFAIVFGAGFVLGTIRTLWVVPQFGTRTAELLESPIMLFITFIAARWMASRQLSESSAATHLWVGLVALTFLLATEFTFVLSLRRLTLADYVTSRDPVTGAVYIALLGAFVLMPLIAMRK
jgi:hypothetical protein